jgi:integrase
VRQGKNPATVYIEKQARSTRATHRTALTRVAAILLDKGADPETLAWHAIRYEDAVRLRAELAAAFAPATVNRILAAVRGTLREAWAAGLLDPDTRDRLLYGLPNVRGGRLVAGRALSEGEIGRLFAACDRDRGPAGARDAAIVAVMVAAGLRRAEVAGLDLADVDETAASVRVLGKGNDERRVPLTPGVTVRLGVWLGWRGRGRGPLFKPVRRGQVRKGRLTGSAVWRVVATRARAAGLPATAPHDCRRTAATSLLSAGADLGTVKSVLGHRSISTTCRYDLRGLEASRRALELIHLPVPVAP